MRVIIHLGIHKTGSTYLQQHCFPFFPNLIYLHRNVLAPFKKYVLYGDDFEFSASKALSIFFSCVEDAGIDNPTSKKFLLSDEEFYGNPFLGAIDRRRNLDRLIEVFSSYEVQFFLFVRKQKDLLASLYLQYVKSGGTAFFEQFVSSRRYPLIFSSSYFYFSGYLKYLVSCMGRENTKVFLYEEFRVNSEKILNELGEFVGSSFCPPVKGRVLRSNESINRSVVVPMVVLNRLTRSYKNPFALLPFFIFKAYCKAFLVLSRVVRLSSRTYDFEDAERAALMLDNQVLGESFPELRLQKFGYL